MNALIKYLKKYGYLTPILESELNEKIKYSTKQKGDFFLKQGQVVSSLGVIEEGLVRSFYIKDGREINVWFGFENDIVASVMPSYFNQPSRENIQFLETTCIYYIANEDLNKLYEKYEEMNTIGRKMAEEYCNILKERAFSLQTESATQRYDSLLKKQPYALQRISLGHIASYLGVAQETVSRIRRR